MIYALVKRPDKPRLILRAGNRSPSNLKFFYKIIFSRYRKSVLNKNLIKVYFILKISSLNRQRICPSSAWLHASVIKLIWFYSFNFSCSVTEVKEVFQLGKLNIFKIVNLLGCHVARRSWPHVPTPNTCVLCRLDITYTLRLLLYHAGTDR